MTFKVIQGRWFRHHWKRVHDFLSVLNSNVEPILPRFRDRAFERWKPLHFRFTSTQNGSPCTQRTTGI